MRDKLKFKIGLALGLLILPLSAVQAADISTHTSAGCAFPDTAQSISYATAFGDDADYATTASTMSFTIHNGVDWGGTATSSVTVDNRTGLMWVTDPVDAGISNTYTWQNALAACENLAYAGFSDWRLPNIRELVSIVDYNRQNPAINTRYFPKTTTSGYWSATTCVPNPGSAWAVSFSYGKMYSTNKPYYYYVRCVRGGP